MSGSLSLKIHLYFSLYYNKMNAGNHIAFIHPLFNLLENNNVLVVTSWSHHLLAL